MSRTPVRPFLIAKDEQGLVGITVRSTRFNSQNYPIVTSALQPERFKTATAARAFAKDHLGARDGEFETVRKQTLAAPAADVKRSFG